MDITALLLSSGIEASLAISASALIGVWLVINAHHKLVQLLKA